MKTKLPITVSLLVCLLFTACSRQRYFTSSLFEQQTARHKVIAVLPAEMVFTGKQPPQLSNEDIAAIEETESKRFQHSLYNSILRYANSRRYSIRVNLQDINTTLKLLEKNAVSVRDSWKEDDVKLAALLGVDAVVRMRIEKKRYMSDLASAGVEVGRRILTDVGLMGRLPAVHNRTNDINASCNVISNNITLWNDSYQRGADYNATPDVVIDGITDNFGRNFPYKRRNG